MKYRSIKNSFLAGQISPTVWGRTDLPQYQHACRNLLNAIPKKSGGAYRRPGTLTMDFLNITSATPPRLIPFVVSRQQPHMLVFYNTVSGGVPGAAAFKGYRPTNNFSGGFIAATCTGSPPYQVATVNSAVNAAILGYLNGLGVDDDIQQVQHVQSADTLWMTHPQYKPQKVLHTGLDTFKVVDFDFDQNGNSQTGLALMQSYPYLNQNASAITLQPSATSGVGVTLTASSSYFSTTGGISGAGHVGSIFVINQAGHIGAIRITAVSSGTVATGVVIVNFNTSVSAFTTWWESAWSDFRGWPKSCCIFQQRLIMGGTYHQPDTSWMTTTANFFKFSALGDTVPAALVPNGTVEPSGSTVVLSPSGGTYVAPVDDSGGDGQTTGPSGSQPFRITLSQNTLDQIQWYSPDAQFLIGTQAQEWLIAPQNGAFDVANYTAVVQSKYGSDNVPAIRIGYELIFTMGSGDEVRAYQYNFVDASFFAEPVQLLFDEYPQPEQGTPISGGRRKVKYMSWDISRDVLWCVDTAGNLYGMTRDRKLSVTAWHTHQLGGFDPTERLNEILGSVLSVTTDSSYYVPEGGVICVSAMPNPFSQINDVWVVVKRTTLISGVQHASWQIERMIGRGTTKTSSRDSIYPGASASEPYLVDACVSGPDPGNPATLSLPSTANHLNGLAGASGLVGSYYCGLLGDPDAGGGTGIFKITATPPVAGAATINSSLPVSYGGNNGVVVLGLPFTPTIEPVTVEAGSQIGTAQGAIHAVSRIIARVYKTLSMTVGNQPKPRQGSGEPGSKDTDPAERVVFNDWTGPIGDGPELHTGLKEVYPPSTYSRDDTVYITVPDPMPFELTSIITEADEYDQS